jgi:hypothetical protein
MQQYSRTASTCQLTLCAAATRQHRHGHLSIYTKPQSRSWRPTRCPPRPSRHWTAVPAAQHYVNSTRQRAPSNMERPADAVAGARFEKGPWHSRPSYFYAAVVKINLVGCRKIFSGWNRARTMHATRRPSANTHGDRSFYTSQKDLIFAAIHITNLQSVEH